MSEDRQNPQRKRAHCAYGLVLVALSMLASSGCHRAIVRVETSPNNPEAAPAVTIEGIPSRGNRWSLKSGVPVDIVATWPQGEQVRARLAVERDVVVVLRRDGNPDLSTGGWLLSAIGPKGQANLKNSEDEGRDDADDQSTPDPVSEPDPPEEAPKETTEEIFARARALFNEGQQAFELADYDLAIKRFKEAYELIRTSPTDDTAEILTNVIYNLAVVYEKSYELTPEPERLRKARIMYRQYDEQMAGFAEDWGSSSEASDVRARVRALDTRINALPPGK